MGKFGKIKNGRGRIMSEQKRLDRPPEKTKSIGQIIGEFAYNKPVHDFSKEEKEQADKVADHIHELYLLSGYGKADRLDRPELREKIEAFVEKYKKWNRSEGELFTMSMLLDQILALIPDIEQIDAMLVEARRTARKQEGKRLLNYLKGLAKSNPKASLLATIDLIETIKPEGEK